MKSDTRLRPIDDCGRRACQPPVVLAAIFTTLCLTLGQGIAAELGGHRHARHPCIDGQVIGRIDRQVDGEVDSETGSIDVQPVLSGPGDFISATGQRMILTDLAPGVDLGKEDLAATAGHWRAIPAGPPNRWNLTPAWVVATEPDDLGETLLQARLLAKGRAVVDPTNGTPDCTAALLAAEDIARRNRNGRWQEVAADSVARPETLEAKVGRHILAEGRIVSLGKTARTRYLNFGRHWKSDVTAVISTKDEAPFERALAEAGLTFEDLAGRAVRIRGYVEIRDGPLIRLTHPGQLELLEARGK